MDGVGEMEVEGMEIEMEWVGFEMRDDDEEGGNEMGEEGEMGRSWLWKGMIEGEAVYESVLSWRGR